VLDVVQDRKRQKVEVLKPVERKVAEAAAPLPEAVGAGVDAGSLAVGDSPAEGKDEQPGGRTGGAAVEQDPELSTGSDEERPEKETGQAFPLFFRRGST
jgi:hypothetical protein